MRFAAHQLRQGQRLAIRLALALAMLLTVLVVLRLLPKTSLHDISNYSAAVYAERGELLRLTLAPDEQYRLWTPLDAVADADGGWRTCASRDRLRGW